MWLAPALSGSQGSANTSSPFPLALLLLFASCLAGGFPDRSLYGHSWFYVHWLHLPTGFWVWEILGSPSKENVELAQLELEWRQGYG